MNTAFISLKGRIYSLSTLTLSSLGLGGLGGLGALTGCAGPNTPIGAVWALTPHQAKVDATEQETTPGGPKILVTPSRQILHGPSPVRLTIQDPSGDLKKYELTVRYNGFDVSRAFVQQSHLTEDPRERVLIIENPVVRLNANTEHLIEFSYRNSQGERAYVKFDPPSCYAFRPRVVTNTYEFKPSAKLLHLISRLARDQGFNPAFFTGLIAQESRFQPETVSWAKAVGLTQITTNAEKEVVDLHENWPRYPGIEEMSADRLKLMILSGRISASNEWRLDSRLSIQGGIEYVKLLSDRWSSEANLERIRRIFPDPEIGMTQLILASYNSGYARVSAALDRDGKDWLKAPELQEARKYVNRIFSYCTHFTDTQTEEVTYARAS